MCVVLEKEVRCSACGEKSWQLDMCTPANDCGLYLDGRPLSLSQQDMKYWLKECPKCGYIEKDITLPLCKNIEAIKKSYKPFDEIKDSNIAARFAKYAGYLSSICDISGACNNFLYSAWVYDDLKIRHRALMMRYFALELANYLADSSFINERKHYILLRADLLRRLGEYNSVLEIQENDYALGEYEIGQLLFEKALAKKEDDRAHTIEECLNYKSNCEAI